MAGMHPFRFAVQCGSALSRTAWGEKARRAEKLGYNAFVLPDHVGDLFAPFPAMLAAADATEAISVGVLVIDNDFRHPLLLAQEAASVHVLTDGRLELGIGAGWNGRDYTALGIPFEPPRVRFEKLAEAVQIVDRYLDGEVFSFSGNHYTVTDAQPIATPKRPTLLIAGGGPRILRLAAERADIVGIFITSKTDGSGFVDEELRPEIFEAKCERVRRIAVQNGRDPQLNILVQHVEVTNDRMGAAAKRAPEYGCDAETFMRLPFELIGTIDQIVADLEERRERFGISYITVYEPYMEAMAPVIERLAGR